MAVFSITYVMASAQFAKKVTVILIPGLFTGRKFWISDSGSGFAPFLAKLGYSTWIIERRGIGKAKPSQKPKARSGLDEHIKHDLSLV